jgi:hypothetical protein
VFPSGAILKFRLACINGVGLGSYSSTGTVLADSVPMQMFAPVVSYTLNHINPRWIFLTWTRLTEATEQSGGDVVVYYKLERLNEATNIWQEITPPYNPSTSSL